MDLREGLKVILVPIRGGAPREFTLPKGIARFGLWAAAALVGIGIFLFISWSVVAARAIRASSLEGEVRRLEAELAQVRSLVARLEEIESQYEQIRELFAGPEEATDDLWLPLSPESTPDASPGAGEGSPTLWPLTEAGFVTQTLLEGGGEHPGIDIAVPRGSYMRAAGSGLVGETGNDPVYGRFVRVVHPEGIETLYAHATAILVRAGDAVRAGEVLGITGSTGRSSAPHLHFEVVVDGQNVDPLDFVSRPGGEG